MKTETTPITDAEEDKSPSNGYHFVHAEIAHRLECSRRRNIRRAWKLRKLNIQRRDDLCAMVRNMAVMNRQRDEAIFIAEEALSGGHRSPCYAEELNLAIRCRCGWRDETYRLENLKQEIECN